MRYTLPSCPLTYHVLTRERNAVDDSPGFDTERFMNLQATNVNGRMQLDGVVVGRSIRDGVRDHGEPTSDYAPPLLETDGLGWTEREGPTWLFNTVSSPGLAWFFPTLPTALTPGKTSAWEVPYNSGQSTAALRVEAARGKAGVRWQLDERAKRGEKEVVIPTTYSPAELRFVDFHLEKGVRVAELVLTSEHRFDSEPVPGLKQHTVTKRRGSYAVAATGRILRAHVEHDEVTTTTTQRFYSSSDARMNLVAACDGPVAPSLEPTLTGEERAQPPENRIRIEVMPPPRKRAP